MSTSGLDVGGGISVPVSPLSDQASKSSFQRFKAFQEKKQMQESRSALCPVPCALLAVLFLHFLVVHLMCRPGSGESRLQLLASFFTSGKDPHTLHKAILARQSRALARVEGLNTLAALLSSTSLDFVQVRSLRPSPCIALHC